MQPQYRKSVTQRRGAGFALRLFSLFALTLATSLSAGADDPAPHADGTQDLFNGKDLSSWVNVNCAPSTWTVRDGMIVCSGKPTGVLRTQRRYQNFELELEYMHLHAGGNAGVFVWSDAVTSRGVPFTRSIEVQVLDGVEGDGYTSHGDIFSIHGAVMTPDRPHPKGWMRSLPSEHRAKPAGQWNHYKIVCQDGRISLAVNGKVVSGGKDCRPKLGYICLESEGSEVHFRNLKIRELEGAPLPAEERAEVDQSFVSLFNGEDLSGWQAHPGHAGHWKAEDWRLTYDGKSEGEVKDLFSQEEYGDFVLIADWRLTGNSKKKMIPDVLPDGTHRLGNDGKEVMIEIDDFGDSGIYLRGNSKSQINIWSWPVGSGEVYGYRMDRSLSPEVRAGVTPKEHADMPFGEWNRFEITMQGDRLTVVLNGKKVIDRAQLPGVPARGTIGLQHHGDPVEFANLYIKRLD